MSRARFPAFPERKLRCGPPEFHPGGGGVNVARAIGALGGKALAQFPAGGTMGRFYRDLLDQEGTRYRARRSALATPRRNCFATSCHLIRES